MESFPAGYWDLFTGFAGVLAGSERIEELVEGNTISEKKLREVKSDDQRGWTSAGTWFRTGDE